MKLMIASDLHGSSYYAKKMKESFAKENPDKLILLGDLLYHGPRNDLPREYNPKEVTEILNGMKKDILCVRGNCEAEVDQMVLEFPVLAEYGIWYLENRMVFFTHGHTYNEENLPMLKSGDILLHGHTHVPMLEDREDYYYMNPGSMAIPKEGSQPGYMTYENNKFTLKNFDGVILKELYIN